MIVIAILGTMLGERLYGSGNTDVKKICVQGRLRAD